MNLQGYRSWRKNIEYWIMSENSEIRKLDVCGGTQLVLWIFRSVKCKLPMHELVAKNIVSKYSHSRMKRRALFVESIIVRATIFFSLSSSHVVASLPQRMRQLAHNKVYYGKHTEGCAKMLGMFRSILIPQLAKIHQLYFNRHWGLL
jgi:hypothetical protein